LSRYYDKTISNIPSVLLIY